MRYLILLIFVSFSCYSQDCEVNKVANVYYLWGQSNMASVVDYTEWNDITINSRVKIWNGSSFEQQSPEPYVPPYSNNGIELELADRLSKLHQGQDVFIIKRAVGSTGLQWHWNIIRDIPSGRGLQLELYNKDIENAYSLLRSQGYNIIPRRVITFIGETDSQNAGSANEFDVNYVNTLDSIRTTIGDINLPTTAYSIWIRDDVQLSFPFPYVSVVNEKYDLMNGTNGINVIRTDDIEHMSDGIHVTRDGFRALENKGF